MKAASAGAYVLAGSTSPASTNGVSIDEVAFLQSVYANGGGRSLRRLEPPSLHGRPLLRPRRQCLVAGRAHLAEHSQRHDRERRQPPSRSGGPSSGQPSAGSPNAMSEAAQAAQITEGYTEWSRNSWAGPLFLYGQRDKRADWSVDRFVQLLRPAQVRLLARSRRGTPTGRSRPEPATRSIRATCVSQRNASLPERSRALRSASSPGVPSTC